MIDQKKQSVLDLDSLVENQLNLQVKISYVRHHDFMIRHQLNQCLRVLDIGTGNGLFAARLAQDHPEIHWIGIDKRKNCVEGARRLQKENFEVAQVDLFSRTTQFDFSQFDGFLMRYFFLHVDHSKKILEMLKSKSKRPATFWIIDLDFSQFTCQPPSQTFDQLTQLVNEFCAKTSVDSMGGQKVLPMLQELGYQRILVENSPFSTQHIPIHDLALYLMQEVQCYSIMSGRTINDPLTAELLRFIDEDVRSGKFQVSYGMVLIKAELI